jgi:hypothetical protein
VAAAKFQNEAGRNAARGQAGAFYEQADRELARQGRSGSSLQQMRYVASRTFYNSGNTWYEGTYEPTKHEKQVQRVKLRSNDYFKLINDDTRVAQYLALGNVVVNIKGQWYQFEE